MIIERKTTNTTVSFDTLLPGDMFCFDSEVYMVLLRDENWSTVRFTDNSLCDFKGNVQVVRLKGKWVED